MKLKDMMQLDLGALVRGKVDVLPKEARIGRRGRMGGRGMFAIGVLRQLQQLVSCNLPLAMGLKAMAHGAPRRHWRIFIAMSNRLEQGGSLAEAMDAARIFPAYYMDIVRAGEVSGNLKSALATLISHSERQRKLAQSWARHMAYVGGVGLIILSIFIFLCIKVYPIYLSMINDFAGRAPGPMRLLVGIADWVEAAHLSPLQQGLRAVILVLAIGGIFFLFRMVKRRQRLVRWELPGMLYVPLLRRAVIATNLAHASGILAAMLKSGYPMDEALESLAASSMSPPYKHLFLHVRKRVMQGQPLSHSLAQAGSLIASPFKSAVALGEMSGEMWSPLERTEALYTERVFAYGQMLISIVFPICIGALGLFVGLICLAAMTAHSTLTDLVLWY